MTTRLSSYGIIHEGDCVIGPDGPMTVTRVDGAILHGTTDEGRPSKVGPFNPWDLVEVVI